jgi:hypothetical protein
MAFADKGTAACQDSCAPGQVANEAHASLRVTLGSRLDTEHERVHGAHFPIPGATMTASNCVAIPPSYLDLLVHALIVMQRNRGCVR